MFKTIQFGLAIPPGRIGGAGLLTATALCAALALSAAPVRANDYPQGLFENSPVVPHGGTYDAAPGAQDQGPAGPGEGGMAGPPQGPMGPDAAGPPVAAAPPPIDDCASMPYRTFSSLAEVKRAHARCDRVHGTPPPGPYPAQ